MLASSTGTYVAVIDGAYILGNEGEPLEVTVEQARVLLKDKLIVLAEGEYLPEDAPAEQPMSKRAGKAGA